MSKLNEQSNFNPEQLCWENAGAAAAQAVYQMRRVDDAGEMLECATLDALMETLIDDGATFDGATFDALVVTNAKIEAKAKQLGAAFNRAGAAITVAENGVTVTKPFKKNGSTQICMMFEMTDGQTITVFLHNPDAKPNTLQASDVLISWKWLLNRKDITIVVAKEHGKDLAVAQVAARVMALVDKNAGRFAKANAGRAARMGAIAALEGEVAAHEATLKGLIEQIEAKKNASNAKEQPETAQTSGNNLAELYEKAKDWTMEKPAFGGKNFGEWLASAPADAFIWIGNHGITVATNVDGEQKGVLVTAVDNPPAYNLLGDAAAAGIKTVGQLRDVLKVTAIEAQVQSAPIVLTGNELGDFDTSTPEGKKALRAALKDYLMAMQGDSVDCPILGDKVMIEKRGIKETLAFTGNPIKMKALYAIKDLIKTARSKDKQANFKADKKGNTQAYFHLKNSVSIDGADVSVDLIVEQTADGHYHYDMLVEKTKATLDSVAPVLSPPTPDNYSGSNEIAPIKPQTADDVNATFDAATGKMVLNLFLQIKDPVTGEWMDVPDEDDGLDGEGDENTHVQAMIAKANSNGFTDLAAFFEQDAAHCLYPFDTLAQIAVDPNKSKEDYLAEAAKVANVMRQTSENADIINDMMVARFGKGNAAPETSPAKTIKDLTDNETYQKILKDSMGGIMFNVADKGKYDVSELLAIWNAIPVREQEAAGGTVNGVMEFVLDGYVHVPQGDEANPVPDADVVKIRDAVDYLRKNYFGGKSDGVVIASEDGTYFKTVNNNKQSITRAVSELGRSHGGSRSFYADTSLSSNYAAGQTLEELGVRVDRSDPKDFVPSWLKVGDVYNMRANGNRVVPAEIQSFGGLLMGKDEPIVNLSSGHTGYNYPLSDFKKRLEGGEFKELEGSLSDFETKKELFSLYVNSKGNEVLSVTKYTTYEGEVSYSIKSSSGSGGTYTYETAKAAVVREKEYVSSMKLKSGHDFLSPNSVDPDVEVQKATDTPVEQAGSNNDQAFLQSIIDGKQSEAMKSPDFADNLTGVYERVKDDAGAMELFNKAAVVYSEWALEYSKGA